MAAENEPYESKESFYHLELCCRYVGEKYGNPAIATWTNRDYIKLSGILARITDVQISPSTLKRIFGKLKTPERYYPQKATRDALAFFAGFKSWETFVEKNHRPVKQKKEPEPVLNEIQQPASPPEIGAKEIPFASFPKKWLPIGIVTSTAVIILVWQLMSKKETVPPVNATGVEFICNNAEGGNPHSANFRIHLPPGFSGNTTNFTVDFGDKKTEKKETAGTLFTHYYEVPGRYYAVLKYAGLPLDTVSVYLKNNGWTATAEMEHDTTRVYPVNSDHLFKNGKLQVNTSELLHAGVDTNHTFFVRFTNVKPMGIDGDNFELTAKVTTSALRPGVRCSQVNLNIYGTKSKHSVVILKPGCVSWASLRFSEVVKDGGTENLSFLGNDLSQGGVIQLRVVHKKVSLFVNDKLIYSTSYQFPLHNLYGIDISFAGIGTVNSLTIKDLGSGAMFQEGLSLISH
ncbi:hypothetical protein [Sediminibacterium soli]|uniref:hypothetical protein n=1 Tax=Sediminibacterium soli TaxID=2698829 RepID=UPI00137B63C9|nr:hypothetical protein [Sediminibacterium soli]NCI46581.1 hypothetical protein [Sediminibacterium soli]